MSDFEDSYEGWGLYDDVDEEVFDCSMGSDGQCEAAGSEDCDECPNNPVMARMLREARKKAGESRKGE